MKLLDAKAEFPIFQKKKSLIYLDSAATTQKPKRVIEALTQFYSYEYATVHRAIYELSMEVNEKYDASREKVKTFLNAKNEEEIVFTRGTTNSINLVARSYGDAFLEAGDEIIITQGEHHSNIVPWQMLAERKKLILRITPVNDHAEICLDSYKKLFSSKTKLVSVAHVYNSTGTINPIEEMIAIAHANGAHILIDGAQAVSHLPVDVQQLDADFYVFSAHKAYGPTGVGILYGKKKLLEQMPPYEGGGDMIDTVDLQTSTYQKPPLRFEAGTPMIASVIGLREALCFIEEVGFDSICEEETFLLTYLTQEMEKIKDLRILGNIEQKVGILNFIVKDVHPLDLGTFLDLKGIAIRTGHHCAQPMLKRLGVTVSCRVSLGVYNTKSDIDFFITSLKEVIQHLRKI